MQTYVWFVCGLFTWRLIVGLYDLRHERTFPRPDTRDVVLLRALVHAFLVLWGATLVLR